MLGCFPDPYPDELFYSVCARYKERMLYLTDKAVSKLVFGRNRKVFRIDNETELEYLISELPPGHLYSIERLKWENTLTPFYQLGSMRNVLSPESLNICPVCFQQDYKQFGEPF